MLFSNAGVRAIVRSLDMDQPARIGSQSDLDRSRHVPWGIHQSESGHRMPGIPYPVIGTNFSVQITFTVNFAKCGAVVKWRSDVSGFGMSTPWVMRRNGVTTTEFDFFGHG
jgi:hypothetical protein